MTPLLIALAAYAAIPGPPVSALADTTFSVRRGDDLVVVGEVGELTIRSGPVEAVAVYEGSSAQRSASVRRTGRTVTISLSQSRSRDDVAIDVPAWIPVTVRGRDLHLIGSGLEGGLDLQARDGEVELDGVTGRVRVVLLDGELSLDGGGGDVRISAGDADVEARGLIGALEVETVDGDVRIDVGGLESVSVDTSDGDIVYRGGFQSGGRYALVTHEGDVEIDLAAGADLDVEVSTFDGTIRSELNLSLPSFHSGRPMSFRIGDGGSSLRIVTFNGDVEFNPAPVR